MLGVLLIDKPSGITSHDVVNQIRRRFGTRRVGHSGTLDPLGTGLLVLAVGPATRFLQYLPLEPKEYDLVAAFGVESTTQDAEGELSDPKPVPVDLRARVEEAIPSFLGLLSQVPPMYSAVKVAGKPLYQYARKGEEREREARSVFVETIELLEVHEDSARMRVVCSGGTYMRTLAHDLGRAIGCGAYLSSLVRTRSGKFTLEDAAALDEALPEDLIPLEEALPPMPILDLNAVETAAARHGQRIGRQRPPAARLVALREPDFGVFGVARVDGNQLQPECVLPIEATHDPV